MPSSKRQAAARAAAKPKAKAAADHSLTLAQPSIKAVPKAEQVALPTHKDLVMRVMPMPRDANVNGDIFGGWIMAQVDVAGAVLPMRMAKGRIATVGVNQFVFKQPVSVGDLLSFYASVTRVGNTSITMHVEVYAQRNPAKVQVVKVTEATLTYVAIDAEGKPRPLPASAHAEPLPHVEDSEPREAPPSAKPSAKSKTKAKRKAKPAGPAHSRTP